MANAVVVIDPTTITTSGATVVHAAGTIVAVTIFTVNWLDFDGVGSTAGSFDAAAAATGSFEGGYP